VNNVAYNWFFYLPSIATADTTWQNKQITIVNGGECADAGTGAQGLQLNLVKNLLDSAGGGMIVPLASGEKHDSVSLLSGQEITLYSFYHPVLDNWYWVVVNATCSFAGAQT
jgi:hypothetical protein